MHSNKKGSILLYVLFLTSFLVLFFLSFQWEIEKTLRKTGRSEDFVREGSAIADALASFRNNPVSSKDISSNLSLISLDYNGKSFSWSLGLNKTDEYWITATGGASLFTLTVSSGWPVFYRLAAFNSGSEASATIFSSWLTTTTNTIALSGSVNRHILAIESLAWYTQYTLSMGSATVIPSSDFYSIERDISGYKHQEGNFEIVNFLPKSYTKIDYSVLGMYLKE